MLPHVWRIWIDQVGDARDILELESNTWCSTSNVWPRLLQQIEYRPWMNFSIKTLGVFVKKSRWEFLMLSWCFENDAEVAVFGFCWEDVILMKLQFSRPGGRTLKFGYPILFLEAYEHPWIDTFKFSFFAFKKSKFQCLNKMAKVIVLIASK